MLSNDKVFEFELRAGCGAEESRVDTQLNHGCKPHKAERGEAENHNGNTA
jgi:hypothetical protein